MKDSSECDSVAGSVLSPTQARKIRSRLQRRCTLDHTDEENGLSWEVPVACGEIKLTLEFVFYHHTLNHKTIMVMQPSTTASAHCPLSTAQILNTPSPLLDFAKTVAQQLGVVYQPVWCVAVSPRPTIRSTQQH